MCVKCVKVKCPDRGNMCVESGSYLANFHECAACHCRQEIKIENKQTDTGDDGEETVIYQHVCTICQHLIAEHQYEFRIDGDYQEYSMMCMLCGYAQDTISILPVDPSKQVHLF